MTRAGLALVATGPTPLLGVALQPIVRWDGHVLGHESLLRGADPVELFATAEQEGWRFGLDLRAARLGLEAAARWQRPDEDLYLNVAPGSLESLRRWRTAILSSPYARPGHLVMEISEEQPDPTHPAVVAFLAETRALGFRVALDDVDPGPEAVELVRAVRPDVVKLSRRAALGAADRFVLSQVAEVVVAAGPALVVAECVEEQWQADALVGCGVGAFQGWLMGRPEVRRRPDTAGWQGVTSVS
jgi:EAL domain-containing protein (putative c-di-GMP-specific phosphodiesterase class I)